MEREPPIMDQVSLSRSADGVPACVYTYATLFAAELFSVGVLSRGIPLRFTFRDAFFLTVPPVARFTNCFSP